MTAQEWLGELERLNEAATPGPWDVWSWSSHIHTITKRPVGPDDERTGIAETLKKNDAAYIVAACGAVPRLLEMLRLAVSIIEAQKAQRVSEGEMDIKCDTMQHLFDMTEPKE